MQVVIGAVNNQSPIAASSQVTDAHPKVRGTLNSHRPPRRSARPGRTRTPCWLVRSLPVCSVGVSVWGVGVGDMSHCDECQTEFFFECPRSRLSRGRRNQAAEGVRRTRGRGVDPHVIGQGPNRSTLAPLCAWSSLSSSAECGPAAWWSPLESVAGCRTLTALALRACICV